MAAAQSQHSCCTSKHSAHAHTHTPSRRRARPPQCSGVLGEHGAPSGRPADDAGERHRPVGQARRRAMTPSRGHVARNMSHVAPCREASSATETGRRPSREAGERVCQVVLSNLDFLLLLLFLLLEICVNEVWRNPRSRSHVK